MEYGFESQLYTRATVGVPEKMKSARVAIAGAGGLGSNIALMLARSGIGELLLVDFDTVEVSNLNRQAFDTRHIGMKKVEALARRIQEINPYVQVKTHPIRVNEDNATSLFSGYPIVCEAFDQAEAKSMLISTIKNSMPDTFIVGASGMGGVGSSNEIKTQNPMQGVYLCGDFTSDMKEGVMAPRVTLCAAHQANMVMRLILGIYEI